MEETQRSGHAPADDTSQSGETTIGNSIDIDMGVMPFFPRTGRERSVVDLTQPDERFSNCVRLDPEDQRWHILETEDLQAGYCHHEALLTSGVPSEIRERINVSQNLATYGWFCYEFCTISLFWSLSCIEMAVWTKFIELHPGPLEIVYRKSDRKERVFAAEAEPKLKQGWRIVGLPNFNFSLSALLTWASDAQLLPHGVDIEYIRQLRNSMAHPTRFNWVLPPKQAFQIYQLLVQIVVALWPECS